MSEYETPYVVVERQSSSFGSFLLGALLGAGVALLLAPRTGRETRDELQKGVSRLRERATDTVRGLQETVSETLDNVRDEVTDRVEVARGAFEAGRQAARDTRKDMERRVEEARTRVRAGVDAARKPPAERATPDADTESDAETGFGI